MTPELQAAAVTAVEKARTDAVYGGPTKIIALKFLRDATGLTLPECVPAIDWALSRPYVTLTRAAKERAVAEMADRLEGTSMGFAYAIGQGDAPEIVRLRARKRSLRAALLRLAMARTVEDGAR